MSNEIKNEFKDFITTLSTEICKEVLLEELKKVNTSLNSTSKEYDELYDKYKFSIEEIKQELSKLDNANKSMSNFTNSINENSKIVNESLKIIKIGQEKSLEKYKADIHKLNATERNEFINSLNTNLSEYSKKYKDELSTIINGSKMNQTLENTEDINKSLKSVNMQINLVKSNIDKLAKDTILKNEEQSNKIYNKLLSGISDLENQLQFTKREIKESEKKIENKIIQLEEEINLKNKIIIGTNIAILVITILFI